MSHSFYQTNLSIIQQRWPQLAGRLAQAQDMPLEGIHSRDGHWIWQLGTRALHSTYSPLTESQRFVETCQGESVLFLGLGCGYHILPFLAQARFRRFLIVDLSLENVKALLAKIDYTQIFNDTRIEFIIPTSVEDFHHTLSAIYHPLWDGQLVTYPLRGLTDQREEAYAAIMGQLGLYYQSMTGDLSSQAFFAKNWFRNIFLNLYNYKNVQREMPIEKGQKAYLVAAGPSLEEGLLKLAKAHDEGTLIITCDAALRPLLLHGISPDYVLSLDAQQIVLRHFVGIPKGDWQLICDLSSPPALTRVYEAQFFSGGHPLSRMTPISQLDTQGGNVGYAVLSFALQHALEIREVFGFDFCFPQAKPYARGVYVYPEFEQNCCRVLNHETCVLDLVFRYKHLEKHMKKGTMIYQPELFKMYQSYFEELKSGKKATLGKWVSTPEDFRGADFVHNYQKKLETFDLAIIKNPAHRRDAMALTLAPLVAHFLQKEDNLYTAWMSALQWAKDFLRQCK